MQHWNPQMRYNITKFLVIAILVSLLTSCAALHSVSITQIPKDRSNVVQAEVDHWTFLGIAFSNDFADGAKAQLQSKCPGGTVTGIITTYETYLYFIMVKRVVKAQGFCIAE